MLKPSDVNLNIITQDSRSLKAIEDQFDKAIREAETSGNWPARVPNARDGATTTEVEAVIARYRAEGWTVSTGRGVRALILAPT